MEWFILVFSAICFSERLGCDVWVEEGSLMKQSSLLIGEETVIKNFESAPGDEKKFAQFQCF